MVITYVLVSELGPPSTQSNAALVFQVVSQKLIVLTFVVNILYQTAEIKKYLNLKKINAIEQTTNY